MTPPAARTFSMVRLLAALTVMGTALLATSAGPWAFWPSALLWAVPPIVAARCLPVPLALAVILTGGVAGRALAFMTGLAGADLFVMPLLATLALLPALVVDKLLVARFPRRGIWAWPLCVAATYFALARWAPHLVDLALPVPDVDGTQMAAAGHPALAVAVTGLVAQGFAGMATILNFHVPDPHPPEIRERGVRVGALVAFALLAAFAVVGLMF